MCRKKSSSAFFSFNLITPIIYLKNFSEIDQRNKHLINLSQGKKLNIKTYFNNIFPDPNILADPENTRKLKRFEYNN